MTIDSFRHTAVRFVRPASILFIFILFVLALWNIHREMRAFSLVDVLAVAHRIGWTECVFAILLTGVSFIALAGNDYLAIQWIQAKVPAARIAMTSFLAQAVSQTAGFAVLTGTSIRYRLYASSNIPIADIARIALFCSGTFAFGNFLFAATIALSAPDRLASALGVTPFLPQGLGAGIIIVILLYCVFSIFNLSLTIKGRRFTLPAASLTLGQIGCAVLDLTAASATLYIVLPQTGAIPFIEFIGIFALATGIGAISHIPGGLGVFESILLLFLHDVSPPDLFAAILFYRLIYNILPLALAAIVLAGSEFKKRTKVLKKTADQVVEVAETMIPATFASLSLFGGVILLASSATPAAPGRLQFIADIVPLPVMEISHAMGSLVGLFLIVLARGLSRRLRSAWRIGIILYMIGALFSLLKGWDYEEALVLAALAVGLGVSRLAFYRDSSLFLIPWGWGTITAGVVLVTLWLSWFSFHTQIVSGLPAVFGATEEAARTLRSSIVLVVIFAGMLFLRYFWPPPPRLSLPSPQDIDKAFAIAQGQPTSLGYLVSLGDKHILFSSDHTAFLMFGQSGRSLVAMGNPIGPKKAWHDLLYTFQELCDHYDSWPVFYQVGPDTVSHYLDFGLQFFKLGEEALVPLESFGLEGAGRASLRHSYNRAVREGVSFELVPAGEGDTRLWTELRTVSDEWLQKKRVREKGFSLGRFDPDYLRRFPLALVRRKGGIDAFATIWAPQNGGEITLDLMRHRNDCASGVMDYLLIELMLWARHQGYMTFSLGVAPLSGLADIPLAPLWTRLGAFVYRTGEGFYNFQGLRTYKDKFIPLWQPRFLAAPGGSAMPQIIMDVATLISGGVKGLIGK